MGQHLSTPFAAFAPVLNLLSVFEEEATTLHAAVFRCDI
jgi:hypothetical protein